MGIFRNTVTTFIHSNLRLDYPSILNHIEIFYRQISHRGLPPTEHFFQPVRCVLLVRLLSDLTWLSIMSRAHLGHCGSSGCRNLASLIVQNFVDGLLAIEAA